MSDMYKEVDGELVRVADMREWAQAMEDMRMRGVTNIGFDVIGDIEVSTAFLGLDMRHVGKGDPLCYETMMFRVIEDKRGEILDVVRYTCREHALACHKAVVEALRNQGGSDGKDNEVGGGGAPDGGE